MMNASLTSRDESDVHAAARLRDMIMGFRVTQMLQVAAKLHLADHLAETSLSAEELATIERWPGRARLLDRRGLLLATAVCRRRVPSQERASQLV
jgi:hypothetical protein